MSNYKLVKNRAGKVLPVYENIKIEKLNAKGAGIGFREDGKKLVTWGALPGEVINCQKLRRKGGKIVCRLLEVLEKSPDRVEPADPKSFTSTSPFQILERSKEIEFKRNWYAKLFKSQLGNIFDYNFLEAELSHTEGEYNYRNKMEFTFFGEELENGKERVDLSFFMRGTSRGKYPVKGSSIASKVINEVAAEVVELLNRANVSARDLKSIVLRSNLKGECVFALFVKDSEFEDFGLENLLANFPNLLGAAIYYSDPLSPAPKPTDIITRAGTLELGEEICGKKLKFGVHSFFQINIPVFELFIKNTKQIIEKLGTDGKHDLVDMYSGVGSIGISIAEKFEKVTMIEVNNEAVAFCRQNILHASLQNATAILSPSEKALEHINAKDVLFLDPPREGLHKAVIKKINEEKPPYIFYLSCNPNSQLENLKALGEFYEIKEFRLYDFFPNTPHVESFVVLERKKKSIKKFELPLLHIDELKKR